MRSVMVMWLLYGIFLVVISVMGCADNPQEAIQKLNYYKDTRTNLCYAIGQYDTQRDVAFVFTYVPCEKIPANLLKEL